MNRRLAAALTAGALVLAACGGGDQGGGPTTTAPDTTTTTVAPFATTSTTGPVRTSTTTSAATTTTVLDDLAVSLEPSSIWMATDSDEVCSPDAPAVAVLELPPIDGVDKVVARFTSPGGALRTLDVPAVDPDADGGGWRAVIGPFEAQRSSVDTTFLVEVRAGRQTAELQLEVLAPIPCGSGQSTSGRGDGAGPTLDVRSDPADARFVASGVDDCAGRPVGVMIEAVTSGPIASVEAVVALPDGTTGTRALSGGPRQWKLRVGPFAGSAAMPDETLIPIAIKATDSRGGTITRYLTAALLRPIRCDETTSTSSTTSTVPGATTTVPGAASEVGVEVRSSSSEVYATIQGACPAGSTTVVVEARTTGPVNGARVTTRTGAGTTATVDLTETSPGRWSATVGPFVGAQNMPASSDLEIRVEVRSSGGATAADTGTVTLRRPAKCGGATTVPTTSPPTTTAAPTTTTTVAPTTTTTVAPTTTTVPLSVQARTVPNPAQIYATIDGACPAGATSFGVEAMTTGSPTGVQVRITLASGQQNTVALNSQGGGRWTATVGPIPGQPDMPASSAISLLVGATDGNGSTATASLAATLLKPDRC